MTQITKSEIQAASDFFVTLPAVVHPNWVQEARYILRLRAKGYGYGKITKVLNRLYRPLGRKAFNRQTIRNRYLWAIDTYRNNQ